MTRFSSMLLLSHRSTVTFQLLVMELVEECYGKNERELNSDGERQYNKTTKRQKNKGENGQERHREELDVKLVRFQGRRLTS